MIIFLARLLLLVAACCQITPAAAQSTLLYVIGDTGDCELEGTARVAAAARAQPDASKATLIAVGDLAYPTATRERLLECHEPHWGGFKKRLAVPGNHDWRDPGATGFFSIFPGVVPRKVALGGAWHLLLVDSNLSGSAWDAQLGWLDVTLSRSAGECLIAAWHHPRWSSGKHGDNDFTKPLWNRLQGKATLTLHGHDHHFEALPALDAEGNPSPAGVRSFVVGHSGATLYPPGGKAHSPRARYGEWGFLRLELDGLNYRWQAISVNGSVVDADRGSCRPAKATK